MKTDTFTKRFQLSSSFFLMLAFVAAAALLPVDPFLSLMPAALVLGWTQTGGL